MIWIVKYALNSLKKSLMKSILVIIGITLGVMLATTLLLSNESMEEKIQKQIISDYGDYDLQFGYNKNGKYFTEEEIESLVSIKKTMEFSKVLIPYVIPDTKELLSLPSYWGVEDNSPDIISFNILEGRYPKNGAEVAITEAYLDKNNINVGDRIQMQFPNYLPKEVLVVGKLRSPSSNIMGQKAFFSLDWLQKELQLEDKVNLLQVKTNNISEKKMIISEVQQSFDEVKIDERLYLKKYFNKLNAIKPIIFGGGIASLLIVMFLIMGSFYLSVQHRRKQWVLMRILGGSNHQIIGIILIESFLIGCIGSLLGCILGYLFHFKLDNIINDWLDTNQATESINIQILLFTFSLGIIMSILGAFLPALTTRKIPLVQIIKSYIPLPKRREQIQNILGLFMIVFGIIIGVFGSKFEDFLTIDISSFGGVFFIIGILLIIPLIIKHFTPLITKPILKFCEVEALISSRNLIRYRYKVAMPVSILSLGIILSIVGNVYTDEMYERMEYTVKQSLPSDIVIHTPIELRDTEVLSFSYKEKLQRIGEIKEMVTMSTDTTTRIIDYNYNKADQKWYNFMKVNNYQYDRLEVSGTNLIKFEKINKINVLSGKGISELQDGEGAITNRVAENLGIKINDEIKIMSNNKIITIRIVSILVNSPQLPNSTVLVHEDWANKNFDIKGFESIDIILTSNAQVNKIKKEIETILQDKNIEIIDSTEILKEQKKLLNNMFVVIMFLVIIIFLISGIGLINSIISNIFERLGEIGITRSIGATPSQIKKIIVLEGMFLGIIASVIGIIGGLIFSIITLSSLNIVITFIPFEQLGILFFSSVFIGISAGLIATVSLKIINLHDAMKESSL
ncbi:MULTISPECIES: ABC transporter permease [Lysinibacillus]|uniref:ABC transporter permease n=1 Tax=Lysinibacillus TaxID=400634 RepID=UPI00257EBFB2|nr:MULTISPECIES: FtsX-like permease family protein [Lysinibacillus]